MAEVGEARRAGLAVILIALLLVPDPSASQRLDRLPRGSSAVDVIEKVEAEGRDHPTSSGEATLPHAFTTMDWTGADRRECVEAPLHNSLEVALVVRARRIDPVGEAHRFESDVVARPVGAANREGSWFFPSQYQLPSPGTWLLVPTSGDNWGRFVLRVG